MQEARTPRPPHQPWAAQANLTTPHALHPPFTYASAGEPAHKNQVSTGDGKCDRELPCGAHASAPYTLICTHDSAALNARGIGRLSKLSLGDGSPGQGSEVATGAHSLVSQGPDHETGGWIWMPPLPPAPSLRKRCLQETQWLACPRHHTLSAEQVPLSKDDGSDGLMFALQTTNRDGGMFACLAMEWAAETRRSWVPV